MVYRIPCSSRGERELFVRPGVVVSVFAAGEAPRRCRVRGVRRRSGADWSGVEVLVEWLDAQGGLSGALAYQGLAGLHPDSGPLLCPVPRRRPAA